MSYFELATLKTVIFGAGKAATDLEKWLHAPDASGTLLGAWTSDIGSLNEIYLLRSFDDVDALMRERERTHRSANPFGCLDHLVSYAQESYRKLDFIGEVEPGAYGPFYEIRTYVMKPNGLVPTMEKWQAALPKREEYSPCTIAMYGIDGFPRLTQIWPYESLEARGNARGQSVAEGNWPPKGGPDWLTPDMSSTIAMPMAFSPLK